MCKVKRALTKVQSPSIVTRTQHWEYTPTNAAEGKKQRTSRSSSVLAKLKSYKVNETNRHFNEGPEPIRFLTHSQQTNTDKDLRPIRGYYSIFNEERLTAAKTRSQSETSSTCPQPNFEKGLWPLWHPSDRARTNKTLWTWYDGNQMLNVFSINSYTGVTESQPETSY